MEDLVDERPEAGEDEPALRDVIMYVVGTGSYPGLDRMIEFLAGVHDVPIPVDEEAVRSIFGEDGWRHMTKGDVDTFVDNLDRLFERIRGAWNAD